jgi:hypothetical protein
MFGLRSRRRRVARLARGAAARLEPDEAIVEVVQVQTGQSALANAGDVASSYSRGAGLSEGGGSAASAGPHVLVATDRHVLALRLGGGRLLDVGEVVHKVPLGEAEVRLERGVLVLGDRRFHVMWGFGPRAQRLVEHADARGRGADEGR